MFDDSNDEDDYDDDDDDDEPTYRSVRYHSEAASADDMLQSTDGFKLNQKQFAPLPPLSSEIDFPPLSKALKKPSKHRLTSKQIVNTSRSSLSHSSLSADSHESPLSHLGAATPSLSSNQEVGEYKKSSLKNLAATLFSSDSDSQSGSAFRSRFCTVCGDRNHVISNCPKKDENFFYTD